MLGLALVLSCATRVEAQADASHDAEARGLFDAATAAFDDGRFDEAFAYFERSHALSGRPQLLFNLASTSERLRRDADAIGYYEQYLAALPAAENRRFVEGRIAFLRASLARATPSEDPAHELTVPDPAELASQHLTEPTSEQPTRVATTSVDEDASRRRRRAIWISVAAVVVSGAAVGLVVALHDPGRQSPIAGDVGAGGIVFTLSSGARR